MSKNLCFNRSFYFFINFIFEKYPQRKNTISGKTSCLSHLKAQKKLRFSFQVHLYFLPSFFVFALIKCLLTRLYLRTAVFPWAEKVAVIPSAVNSLTVLDSLPSNFWSWTSLLAPSMLKMVYVYEKIRKLNICDWIEDVFCRFHLVLRNANKLPCIDGYQQWSHQAPVQVWRWVQYFSVQKGSWKCIFHRLGWFQRMAWPWLRLHDGHRWHLHKLHYDFNFQFFSLFSFIWFVFWK